MSRVQGFRKLRLARMSGSRDLAAGPRSGIGRGSDASCSSRSPRPRSRCPDITLRQAGAGQRPLRRGRAGHAHRDQPVRPAQPATTSPSATCCPPASRSSPGSASVAPPRSSRTRRPRPDDADLSQRRRPPAGDRPTRSTYQRRARRPTTFDVGDTYTNTGRRLRQQRPALPAALHAPGEPVAGRLATPAARPTTATTTLIAAIEVAEVRAEPRGRAPARRPRPPDRLHAHASRNNDVKPDRRPRGRRLAAGRARVPRLRRPADNTTDAPTNPGSPLEYPGSGPLDAGTPRRPDCVAPALVETVADRPRRRRPAAAGVYTHVRWTGLGHARARRRARDPATSPAIPIRANTLDLAPARRRRPASGDQGSNLDNNGGAETTDEQALTNYAQRDGQLRDRRRARHRRRHAHRAPRRTCAILKSVDQPTIAPGRSRPGRSTSTPSEYRCVDDIRRHRHAARRPAARSAPRTSRHAAAGGRRVRPGAATTRRARTRAPPRTRTAAGRSSGTRRTDPSWRHRALDEPTTITFPTRTRANYQENFADDAPVLAERRLDRTRSAHRRAPTFAGAGRARIDASPTGTHGIDDVAPPARRPARLDDRQDRARARARRRSTATPAPTSTRSPTPTDPGDRVCWRVRVDFPRQLDTRPAPDQDFLPDDVRYVPGSMQYTADHDIDPGDIAPRRQPEPAAPGR